MVNTYYGYLLGVTLGEWAMGSDVQWQIDNGYLAQVMGDFSTESPSFEMPMFGRYFDTFQAAIHVAKAFPGSTLQPSEYEDKTGMVIRHYYVDCHPYYDGLPPEKAMIFSMMNTLLLFMWLRVLIKPAKNSTNYCLVVDIGKMVRGMQVR